MEEKKNVYITVHKSFVREGIEYFDKKTGQMGKFNSVTLPRDTVMDGMDLSFYQFSPLFVNESRFKGEDFRDIPLLADKEVWLKRTVMDPDGNPVTDESGRPVKDTVKVMPVQLKEALDSGRERYLASLSERAKGAREGSRELAGNAGRSSMSREDIPF